MGLTLRNAPTQQSPLTVTQLDANFTYLEHRIQDGTTFGQSLFWNDDPTDDSDPQWQYSNSIIQGLAEVRFNLPVVVSGNYSLTISNITGGGGFFTNPGYANRDPNTFFGDNVGGTVLGSNDQPNTENPNGVLGMPRNLTAMGRNCFISKTSSLAIPETGKNYEGGDNSTAFGYNASQNETSGRDNVAAGSNALSSNTRGKKNIAIGSASLQSLNPTEAVTVNTTRAESNIAIGFQAGKDLTTGRNNTIIGQIDCGAEHYPDLAGNDGTMSNTLLIGTGELIRLQIDGDGVKFNSAGNPGTDPNTGQPLPSNLILRSLPVAGTTQGALLRWDDGTNTANGEASWKEDATVTLVPIGNATNQFLRWTQNLDGSGTWNLSTQIVTGALSGASSFRGGLESPTGGINFGNFKGGRDALSDNAMNSSAVWVDFNVALGYKSLIALSPEELLPGTKNVAVGANSGLALVSGVNNTLIGGDAGSLITAGSNNTFIGSNTGAAATTDTVLISSGVTERIKVTASGLSLNTVAVHGQHGPILKILTTTEVNELTTQVEGEIVFDLTLARIKVYNGTSWITAG